MGYDIHIMGKACPTCNHSGEYIDIGNQTYNISPMYSHAMQSSTGKNKSLNDFNGMTCKEALVILEPTLKQLSENPEIYTLMNPPNGWGSYEGAVEYLSAIVEGCNQIPEGVLNVY